MMISQDGALDRGSVAVVVPAYNRAHFTRDEEVSFRHLEHVLGRYDKFLVVRGVWRLSGRATRFNGSTTAISGVRLQMGN